MKIFQQFFSDSIYLDPLHHPLPQHPYNQAEKDTVFLRKTSSIDSSSSALVSIYQSFFPIQKTYRFERRI